MAAVVMSSWHAAMQVGLQLQVIGKRVKSYTMSVDDARKVRLHIQHEQNWAKVEPCGTEQTMYKQQMRYVPPAIYTRLGMSYRTGMTEPFQSCSTQAKLTLESQQQQLVIDSVKGSC